jgi:hypothetical protein
MNKDSVMRFITQTGLGVFGLVMMLLAIGAIGIAAFLLWRIWFIALPLVLICWLFGRYLETH